MPDFNTCLKLLQNQTHRTSDADAEMASIAIINAMDFFKGMQWGFNQGWQQFFLAAGTDRITSSPTPGGFPSVRLSLPHGIVRPLVIQVVGIVNSGDVVSGFGTFSYTPVYQQPLRQVAIEELWAMQGGPGQLRTSSTGYPTCFAWLQASDGTSNSIRIAPAPHVDLIVDCFYVQDAHRPRYRWDGEAWAFDQLTLNSFDGSQFWQWTPMVPTFENIWLTNAEPLIRARAIYDLQLNFYHDEGAAKYAQVSLGEEIKRLDMERVSGIVGTIQRYPSCL